MPKDRTRQSDPILDLLYQLRTQSYQNNTNYSLLIMIQSQVIDCLDTPWRQPVLDILAWLTSLDDAATTLHNKLDQIIPFLETVGACNLRMAMENLAIENLIPQGKTLDNDLSSYFSALKGLWAFLTVDAPEPDSLKFKGQDKLTPHPIMTRSDLDVLIDQAANYFGTPAGGNVLSKADDAIVFLLLTSHCRLRYAEASENLRLGQVWLVDQHLTVLVERGKGGRPRQETSSHRLPKWAAAYLNWYIQLRFEQGNGDPQTFFYGGGLITEDDNGYHRLYQFFLKADFPGSPHELRRYGGNLGRVRGESLLDCINHFGQTTSATAPHSYLSSLCLVQWQHLYSWANSQPYLTFPSFSTQELAAVQGISREHARRLGHAANIKRPPRQSLSLAEATHTLKVRIQTVQDKKRPTLSKAVSNHG